MRNSCRRIELLIFLLVTLSVSYGQDVGNHHCTDTKLYFACGDGTCVVKDWRCDGAADCRNGNDEQGCSQKTCTHEEFDCGNNTLCIPKSWVCDQEPDCPNKSDENDTNCNKSCETDQFPCIDGKCIPSLWVCDEMEDCAQGEDEKQCSSKTCSSSEFRCKSEQCIANQWHCDGDTDCQDGTDEIRCPALTECSKDHFKCNNTQCIPSTWHCDGDHDCDDHSDEFKCITLAPNCEIEEWQCATTDQCIHLSWHCDGDKDCFDDSDEKNCTHTCATDQFKCTDNQCIPLELKCDGEFECSDGSDETDCQSECNDDTGFGCQTKEGYRCLPWENVCDGTYDCLNDEDELKCGSTGDPCSESNGGCLQKCVKIFRNQHRCECHEGYKQLDSNSCEDINECADRKKRVCSQGCVNTKGSYKCSCIEGYTLEKNGFCRVAGVRPQLLVANRFDIRTLQVDTWWEQTVLEDLVSAVAVDFDYNDALIFWTDLSEERIFSARKAANGSAVNVKIIVEHNLSTPDGLAIDWVYNHVYWTDAGHKKIEVMSYDGQMRKNLISIDLDEPRAIVVDPLQGWMYWTDWGSKPMISRAGLNGKHQSVIVKTDIMWPNGLTLDHVDQRLFWIDAKLNKITSVDTNGDHPITVLNNAQRIIHPFAITVFEDSVYWTDWKAESIRKVNKFRGDDYNQVAIGLHSPMDINFYHKRVQANGTNYCVENPCSHFCLPSPQGNDVPDDEDKKNRFSCECPNGYKLNENKTICAKGVDNLSTPPPTPLPPKNSTESSNKVPISAVTTKPTPTKKPATKTTTQKPTEAPEISTQEGYTIIVPTSQPASINRTENTIYVQSSSEKVGLIAGIVVVVVAIVFAVIGVVCYVLYRRYTNRSVKSMNFDNPVYKKTVEDHQFIIPSSNPALQPLTKPEV